MKVHTIRIKEHKWWKHKKLTEKWNKHKNDKYSLIFISWEDIKTQSIPNIKIMHFYCIENMNNFKKHKNNTWTWVSKTKNTHDEQCINEKIVSIRILSKAFRMILKFVFVFPHACENWLALTCIYSIRLYLIRITAR